jgi:hypothetical protein
MLLRLRYFQRDRRAAAGHVTRSLPRSACYVAVTRMRRGVRGGAKSVWRRTTTGSNHISAYGVWRDHVRRAHVRVNRTGETRWHRLPAATLAVHFFRERQ